MKKAKNILATVVLFQLTAFCFAQTPQSAGNGVKLITVTNPAAMSAVRHSMAKAQAAKNKSAITNVMENKSISENTTDNNNTYTTIGSNNNDDNNFDATQRH